MALAEARHLSRMGPLQAFGLAAREVNLQRDGRIFLVEFARSVVFDAPLTVPEVAARLFPRNAMRRRGALEPGEIVNVAAQQFSAQAGRF